MELWLCVGTQLLIGCYFDIDSSGICHLAGRVLSAGLQQREVSYLPVEVGLRPQCRPTSRRCLLDDCLCDNCLVCHYLLCLCVSMISYYVVVVWGEIVPGYRLIEEPVEIMDREIKKTKQSRIPIVKVHWNAKRGPEFTWEREDQMHKKYPHLLPSS